MWVYHPSSQTGWRGDTPTHAYPHAQAPARLQVALLLDITRPGCRGIRVWPDTTPPDYVAMPRGRHG